MNRNYGTNDTEYSGNNEDNEMSFLQRQQNLISNIPKKRNLLDRDADFIAFDDKTDDRGLSGLTEQNDGNRIRQSSLDPGITNDKNSEEDQFEQNKYKRFKNNDQNETEVSIEQQRAIRQSIEMAKNLPIAKHKHQILKKLEQNRVIIISGDTGCGKTTQVPKYLLEHGAANNQDVNIICTQPRKLAAVNIAKRVALELQDRVGYKVGYQVGMESRNCAETRVMFMTTGIFLMRIVNNPDQLQKYTHIIMDEVHERDLDIDFSLVVIKHLLSKFNETGNNFKLILMSATFNTELFANYFSKNSIAMIETVKVYEGIEEQYKREEEERNQKLQKEWGQAEPNAWDNVASLKQNSQNSFQDEKDNDDEDEWVEEKKDLTQLNPVKKANDPAEIIEINARLFKVTEFYIDQIIKNIQAQREQLGLTAQDKELLHEAFESFHSNKPSIKEGIMRVASIIICDIIERQNTFKDTEEEKKGILVFLPGLHEIFEFIEFIKDFYNSSWISQNLELIPLHSSLSQEEQDRAFRSSAQLLGKRKVILATNIAESSITIPDIKYVIDFMLTKELYYDPVSKSETLQLHYSSKASSKQRAGRAGRVADGFIFRMCSSVFFENGIPEYPKPEMQRCPLEKLILQVKLWGKYEPEQILGRAIQPPEYRDICNAIKNLQATGALTIAPPFADSSFKPKITALGKIFVNMPCDLKITRIFLFGMALKCMHQAIIMGCIHSQQRSIFRGNRNIDQINLTKLQCGYDQNRDSDSIMLLRVFDEWQRTWHRELTYKEDQFSGAKDLRGQNNFRPNSINRRIRLRITPQEKKWCSDKSLDVNILRETALMVEEIKMRFLRMNIPEKCLNSRVRLDDEHPDSDLILKTCIGGAFYNKYIKAQYKNEDLLNRMKSSELFESDGHQRALILNKVSDFITEDHLKQFFETKFKVSVDQIKMSIDKPLIIFGQDIIKTGFIKACFKLGTRNRSSRYKRIEDEEFEKKQQFKSQIMTDNRKKAQNILFSYDEIKEKLECEELRRPNFLYELRFETMNRENYVDFDMDSINNFTYELDTFNLNQVTFACQDFHDKGGRFLCKSGTRLPSVPMVDALFCLIFAPMVQVIADDERKYFNKIICDGGESIIHLTHVLTHHDLETIQKIRNMLNETLCNEDNIKQAHMAQVDFHVKKVLSFQRLSLDIYIKLLSLRDEDQSQDMMKFLKKQQKLKDEATGQEESNFFLEEEIEGSIQKGYQEINMETDGKVEGVTLMESLDRTQRQDQETEKGYFLQPIYAQKIDKKIFLYDDLVNEMKQEFEERLANKRKIIEKMKHKCKELHLKDVTLICDKCQQDVSLLKTVSYISDDTHHAKCSFGNLTRVEIDQAVKDTQNLYQSQDNKEFIEMYLEIFKEKMIKDEMNINKSEYPYKNEHQNQQQILQKYAFCECRNHHLIGIVCDQKFYFTDVSQLRMMFPQGHYEDWCSQFWSPGYKEAFELQSKLNIKRAQESGRISNDNQSEEIECELCNKKFHDQDEFILHCNKDKNHLLLSKQFSELNQYFKSDDTYNLTFKKLDKIELQIKARKEIMSANRFNKE